MPLYLFYFLQPLDMAYFLLLKHIYSDSISQLIYTHINLINKETFLLAFKTAFKKSFIKDNIYAGFRDTGLIPLDLEIVISKLDI